MFDQRIYDEAARSVSRIERIPFRLRSPSNAGYLDDGAFGKHRSINSRLNAAADPSAFGTRRGERRFLANFISVRSRYALR